MKTRAAIAVTGMLGLVTVLRTSLYYANVDRVAFLLTLLMVTALGAGLVELWRVARRNETLSLELGAIPAEATAQDLEKASPSLRALVQARLDRSFLPVPGPVFAPFVVGLLVMLGLLGTFMGLFETLRGATIALSTGSDIEALRSGLKTPMLGLMRSFGTSAAGVAASAMLGLATVFTRRASSQLSAQLQERAIGSLSHLSDTRRQLNAFESLSNALAAALTAQERAVPDATDALQKAHETLAARTTTIDAAIDRQLSSMQDAVDAMCKRLEHAEAHAQRRLEETFKIIQSSQDEFNQRSGRLQEGVAKQLADAIATLGEAHVQQLQHVMSQQQNATKQLADAGQQLLQAESAMNERQQGLVQRMDAAMQSQAESSQAWQTNLAKQHAEQLSALAQLFSDQLSTQQQVQERNAQLLEEAAASVQGGGVQLLTLAETFTASVEQHRQNLREWVDNLGDVERAVTEAGEAAAADVLGEHLARTHEVFDRQLRFQQEVVEQLRTAQRRESSSELSADVSA